jgi:lysyl endopeptidase
VRPIRALAMQIFCAALLSILAAAGVAHAGTSRDVVAVDFVAGIDAAIGTPERFAIEVPYASSPISRGAWSTTGTTHTWHWEVQVPGAVSLSFHASRVLLPPGASLSVTGGDIEYTYGMARVHHGELWSRITHSDTLTFDLTLTGADPGSVTFDIVGLQAGFRTLGSTGPNHPYYDSLMPRTQASNGTTDCVQNYECNLSAADLGPGQASVALIVGNTYLCSAVLLNDVPGDGTPYVLTARHCENGNAEGGDPEAASSATLLFDATTPCGQALGNIYDTETYQVSGATTVVEQQDTWLMKFFDPVTVPDAYFAGWDATGAEFSGGYTAHYGLGNNREYTGWSGDAYYAAVPGTEFGLNFVSTVWGLVNGVGSVAPGASGSGLFDPNNRLVGTLARAKLQGTQATSPGVCPVPNPPAPGPTTVTAIATALSGVFDSTADPDSTTGSVTIRSLLDPQNTGTKVVNGTWTPPVFTASNTNPNTGSVLALQWSTAAGTSCVASGGESGDGWGGAIPLTGSQQLIEYAPGLATYVVTCYLGNYHASHRLTVNWTLATPQAALEMAFQSQTFTGFVGPAVLQRTANVTPCVASGGSAGDGWSGPLSANGTKTIMETSGGKYTYVLTCGSGTRTATSQLTLSFLPINATLSADQATTANIGQTILLTGSGQGLHCTTSGGTTEDGWAGVVPGSEPIFILDRAVTETTPGSYTYTFSCTGAGQTVNSSVTLTFLSAPPSVTVSWTTNGTDGPTVGFSVLQLSWISTVTPCTITVNGYVNETASDTRSQGSYFDQQYVVGSYAYTVTCGSAGSTASASTMVNWGGTPTVSVQTSNTVALLGTPFNVEWASNITPCVASGGSPSDGWSGNSAQAQGSVTVTEAKAGTYTYNISCGSAPQTATASTSVTVNPGPATAILTASATTASTNGSGIVLSWNSNTSPCVRSGPTGYWGFNLSTANSGSDSVLPGTPGTYTYRIQCGVGANTASAQVTVTFTGYSLPVVSASNSYQLAGRPFTLSWNMNGTRDVCGGSGGSTTDGWSSESGSLPATGTMQIVEPNSGIYNYGTFCFGSYTSVVVQPNLAAAPAFYHSSGQLDLPTLVIGDIVYSNISVMLSSDLYSQFSPDGPPAPGNVAYYNLSLNQLILPAVSNGSATYTNMLAQAGALISIGSVTGADTYDGSHLSIPTVQINNGLIHNNVVVTVTGVVSVAGGMPLITRDNYDPATGQLTIPVVAFGGHCYTNVTVTVGSVISVGD